MLSVSWALVMYVNNAYTGSRDQRVQHDEEIHQRPDHKKTRSA